MIKCKRCGVLSERDYCSMSCWAKDGMPEVPAMSDPKEPITQDTVVGKLGPGEMFNEGGCLYLKDLEPQFQQAIRGQASSAKEIARLREALLSCNAVFKDTIEPEDCDECMNKRGDEVCFYHEKLNKAVRLVKEALGNR